MNDLPQIDPTKVADTLVNSLATENLDLRKKVVTLELLATALRDERNALREVVEFRDSED